MAGSTQEMLIKYDNNALPTPQLGLVVAIEHVDLLVS